MSKRRRPKCRAFIRDGSFASVSSNDRLATEGLVLLFESDEPESDWGQTCAARSTGDSRRLDVDLLDVRVVARSTLRKSTSGKLAREGNRQWYLEGRFGAIPAGIAGGE